MEYTTLGRTGLRVSRVGLGCGGHSKLGLAFGKTDEEAAVVVREAISLGVNLIDTAASYGTEGAIALGIAHVPRHEVILSTKVAATGKSGYHSPAEYRAEIEGCLRRLGTDYVDVFNVHGVVADEYSYVRNELVPVIETMKSEGKIRFIGITEHFILDTRHVALAHALARDDCWDVMMVGFSFLNQTARERVFPFTLAKGIGTLGMFAVRRALSNPEALRQLMSGLVAEGSVKPEGFDHDDPLGFLVGAGVAGDITEAAYRFCRDEPGMDVVLSGTSRVDHLRANVAAFDKPALLEDVTARVQHMFAGVDTVSGN